MSKEKFYSELSILDLYNLIIIINYMSFKKTKTETMFDSFFKSINWKRHLSYVE